MARAILVADDSATIRKVVELTFSRSDYHVETVSNGSEALERIDVLHPDLVLADAVMPEPSGFEICRRIKSSARPVPVILLAGTFEPFDVERARSCGADEHLIKPFDSSLLLERVERLLVGVPPRAQPIPAPPAGQETAPEPAVEDEPRDEPPSEEVLSEMEALGLSANAIEAIARVAVRNMSDRVVRELAREILPRVAERVVRERIHELEREED